MYLRRSARLLVDTLYPRRCAGCGRRDVWLCAACDAALPRLAPPWCAGCGVSPGVAACRCDNLPRGVRAFRSVAPYAGWLREAIVAFKYDLEWDRADHLAATLVPALGDLPTIDALVPVPLHPCRLRWRGFNQSVLLAEGLGRRTAIPVLDWLERTRETDQQARLGAAARWANVSGAFAVRAGVDPSGLHLAVVDDVLTTGATLGACAEALLAGGAAAVSAVTLAREG
jgi:ComF family protein